MSKKSRLTLEDLKVQSFVTRLEAPQLQGGVTTPCTTPLITLGCTQMPGGNCTETNADYCVCGENPPPW